MSRNDMLYNFTRSIKHYASTPNNSPKPNAGSFIEIHIIVFI